MERTSLLTSFLARVRTLLYRHEARRAALYALASIAGLAVVLPLLGYLVGESRATAFAVLGIATLGAVLVIAFAIVMGIVAPRRRWGRDPDVARWVGGRHRAIASDLLSSVELVAAPARVGAPSPSLVEALIASTTDRLDGVEPRSLLPTGELRRARRWALLGVVLNLAVVIAAPHVVATGWRSLVASPPRPFDGAQLSAVPLVGDLEATLTFPPYAKRPPLKLPSSSGDVRGLPGTLVTLRARVLVPAASVEVVLETDPKNPGKPVVVKLEGEQLTTSLTIDRSVHYRFAVTSPDGDRAIETTPRAIEAEADQAPTVQLLAPSDTLDVTNLRRVELAYVIEDDFGLTSAELIWEAGKDRGKKLIPMPTGAARAQGKIIWDIAEVQVPSGGDVRYWLEVKDNDAIGGPNIGRSHELHLRVVSPRERHEETLARQQELAEKVLHNLGARLVGPGDDQPQREELSRGLRDAVTQLASIDAAYEKDPHASDAMRKALLQMHDRIDKLAAIEVKLIPKNKVVVPGRYAGIDPRLVAELEDDTLILADWLDRERLEGLLDLHDEITAHQKRLADLLAEYARSKDPRLLDDIERELRALDRTTTELLRHERVMPEEVLDQYVNRDALAQTTCTDEVRRLVHEHQIVAAQAKLADCQRQHERQASALEGSLAAQRGDKFSDEQKKLDEVMNELADVTKDQDDIATEANRIFEAYAEKADVMSRDHRREAAHKVGALIDKLRKRIAEVNETGLTPFAKEELDIVERRLTDVEHMVGDGDLAEALGMAHQAKQSLDTIAGELEAAINDDPKSKWADATQEALDGIEKSRPIAKDLIDLLQSLSPRPDQIMSADDQRALDRLRRRQAMNKERGKRLGDRTKQLGSELPGDTGQELGKRLGGALDQMGMADERMKGRDPSGARAATRSAADALAKARDRARNAARQAQEGSARDDETIRIPGADEYRAPERFREELLEAMKKGTKPPDGYDEMIKRYYEDLVK